MRELLLKADKEKRSIFKITVLVLLFFGANLFLSFATDTYLTFADGLSSLCFWRLWSPPAIPKKMRILKC